jgi:hypothetical protein
MPDQLRPPVWALARSWIDQMGVKLSSAEVRLSRVLCGVRERDEVQDRRQPLSSAAPPTPSSVTPGYLFHYYGYFAAISAAKYP